MDVAGRASIGADELVAYDLAPGPRWLGIVEEHVARGVAFLPIDHRLPQREKRRVVDRARPTRLVTEDDTVLFADGAPADPARSLAVVGTSGATGEPKLVELPAGAIDAAADESLATLQRLLPSASIRADDPWICCLTPAHVGGLLVLMRVRRFGAPVVVHETFDPDRLLLDAPAGAHVALVPTMLRRLVDARADLSRFGVVLVGGGAVGSELRDVAAGLGARVVSTYGLTETCGGVVYDGTPFVGTEVRIGEGGAIELRGPTLMEGYRLDPAATGAAFSVDGWLRTADVGSFGPEGALVVHGRADDAIRTGAETVWPAEVERILLRHAKVADVAVAARPDPEWGSHVAAWIVPIDAADPPSLEDLRALARDHLASYKAPREVIVVRALPRTSSGKLRRSELPPG
jgi:acyl-CoA synthetase (AMP-forming)/AMP-acid ligase II